jgi:tetratricopeptide (TPR) repeat protein
MGRISTILARLFRRGTKAARWGVAQRTGLGRRKRTARYNSLHPMKATTMMLLMALAPLVRGQDAGRAVYEITSPLGTKFYSLADGKGVVAAARKAAAAEPGNADLLLKLAQAEASVWQEREAVEACTRALALAADRADLLTERGHRYLPLREFEKARADLTRAVALDPKNMAGYYHLGLAHYFLGEFAAAAEAFRHAVETAPNTDERINSSNWLYAALRRANQPQQAAEAAAAISPEMTNQEPHTLYYLNLVRLFQGRMTEDRITPPEPPRDGSDTEAELRFDTVVYGIGNWHLYNGDRAKAQQDFERVLEGKVWVTWGFLGAEREVAAARRAR